MDELERANKRIKTAGDNLFTEYHNFVELKQEECNIKKRHEALEEKKAAIAEQHGHPNSSENDLIEINAGGKIIAAKRGTLCQLRGSRLEALFSGRWDKRLQRDGRGRIFLDVNPDCFQGIVDYLNEVAISTVDNIPAYPAADHEEDQYIMDQLLELFTLKEKNPSKIIKDTAHIHQLHQWLGEEDSDGIFHLLYQSSRDGLTNDDFHSKCDNKGPTLSLIETTDGLLVGGYSSESWFRPFHKDSIKAKNAFLFVLAGDGISSPQKLKLKNPNDERAIYRGCNRGVAFGAGLDDFGEASNDVFDLAVKGSYLSLRASSSYEPIPSVNYPRRYQIRKMEVFKVSNKFEPDPSWQSASSITISESTMLNKEINDALNEKVKVLKRAEWEVTCLENDLGYEKLFVDSYVLGETKDIVQLNVSGKAMATKRSTLQAIDESVLARQFDDSMWTEQGFESSRVEEWTAQQVTEWAKDIKNITDDVADIFAKNQIAGNELLALEKDGLIELGIERIGTRCLLLKEIEKLEQSSQNVVTLIEHSPYCFGKMLDYLRLKELHSKNLADVPPPLPVVRESSKSRFEKVVNYFFPGKNAKLLLG